MTAFDRMGVELREQEGKSLQVHENEKIMRRGFKADKPSDSYSAREGSSKLRLPGIDYSHMNP
jgi:hypothetical protein